MSAGVDRRPGHGRYAHPEREQRWLVSTNGSLPPGADSPRDLVDRYVSGTSLRLRHVLPDGSWKLTQKVRTDASDPTTVRLTNVYLDGEEAAVLAALPAAVLSKRRWRLTHDGRTVAVDELGGRWTGLVLAEVELADDEPWLTLPAWAASDVTWDDRFSGGALAAAPDTEVAALLGHP